MATLLLEWPLFLLTTLAAVASPGERAVTHADTAVFAGFVLWDGKADGQLEDAAMVVSKGKIEWIGQRSSLESPAGCPVVDLAGTWVMPGLVDAHVHFFQSAGLYTRPDIIDLQSVRPYAEELSGIKAALDDTFRRYLASGVTAVVDMGGPFWNFDVREAARQASLAPHVAVAGPLISTVARPQLDLGDPPIVRARTPEHARDLAAKQLEQKPDLTKIWFVATPDRPIDDGAAMVAEVARISRSAGVRLAVHATELETARLAVVNGADILVHSVQDVPVDSRFLELVRERAVVYVPNLVVLEGYAEVLGRDLDLSPEERRWGAPDVVATWREMPGPEGGTVSEEAGRRAALFRSRLAVAKANLPSVRAAGVALAVGTDAGNIGTLPGPSLHRELRLMADAGLSNLDVLRAATSGAAGVFSAVPQFGTLEAGKNADFLVLEADPLSDVGNASRIRYVALAGVLRSPAAIVPPSPESVVEEQLQAYNSRDAERFASQFADQAEIFRLPNEPLARGRGDEPLALVALVARGRGDIRETYSDLFQASPGLNCRVIQRTVMGRYVVDQELVTGLRGRSAVRAIAVYEVVGGLIQRCWLMKGE